MKRTAIILFKKKKEKEILDILNSELDVERQKKRIDEKKTNLGVVTPVGKDYLLWQLNDVWVKYKDFDNFLIRLVQDFGFYDTDKNALLIGHTAEDGYLWTDYAKFIDYKEGKK